MIKIKKLFAFLVIINLLMGVGLAQKLSQKEIARTKAQIVKLQKEIATLKKRLSKTKAKKTRIDISGRIDEYQMQVAKLKKRLPPGPAAKPKIAAPAVTIEALPEETMVEEKVEERKVVEIYQRSRFEVGGVTGLFGGATAFMGEARIPLRFVFGPATTSFRVSAGLAQSREMDRRYVPVNADVIFNFPPGWFTGTQNYAGIGLNYVALTSGSVSGTVGGQICYGVESEGFAGTVFGEVGYGALRTGFTPSHKGITVMVGYRKGWGL